MSAVRCTVDEIAADPQRVTRRVVKRLKKGADVIVSQPGSARSVYQTDLSRLPWNRFDLKPGFDPGCIK